MTQICFSQKYLHECIYAQNLLHTGQDRSGQWQDHTARMCNSSDRADTEGGEMFVCVWSQKGLAVTVKTYLHKVENSLP